MHARRLLRLTPATLLVTALALTGCAASPALPEIEAEEPGVVAPEPAADTSDSNDENPPGTEGLSQEAIDQGHTIAQMPSGWADDLPLPDGHPVIAFRDGGNFSLIFDLPTVAAGESIFDWYRDAGWSVESDYETGGVHLMEFGSPETNDYGPLRRVTAGLGMTDWPTAFQYTLTVQDD